MDREARKRRAEARRHARRAKKRRAGRAVSQYISDSEPSSGSDTSQGSDPGSDRRESPEHHGDITMDSDEEHEAGRRLPSPVPEEETEETEYDVSPQPSENSNGNNSEEADAENEADVVVSAGEESSSSPDESESDAESEDMDFFSGSEQSQAESEESNAESEENDSDRSDEENLDNDEHFGNGNDPIYPGAPITLHESLLAIFTLLLVENLSGKLVSNILQLIALHCPEGSIVKKTLVTFKSYFAKLGSSLMVFHYFCADCIYPLKSKTEQCRKCKKVDNVSYFLELPLLHQLQNLFKRENFYEDIQFRFNNNRKRYHDNIEDIYDGQIYKEQMANGFLSNPSNISFMWYTDGVSIFKSSSFSVWPFCLVVNELPYKLRTLPKNILLVGLWFGKSKPSPNVFLRPLYKTMKSFESDGHSFRLHDNSEILVRGKVLCGTCDLPAKSKFLCFKQFNAYYGCPKCMCEGGRATTGKTTVQVFPYQPNIRNRTHNETLDFAKQALEARKATKDASVFGVKGPTLLAKIVPDIIKCTGIDIMHGVFLGVFKMILDLWLSPSFSGMPWSVSHLSAVLDEKLCKIKSPNFADRAPRTLKEIKFWKASEYKQFMLYYSVPLLKNVLEEAYLKHHCTLVAAVSLLSQDSISLDQIRTASALLASYVSEFARLYPLRYLGLNVHQLLHLADVTLEIGPSWVCSCFFLESFNGVINKMFHGTQHIALQICSTVSMMMKIPEFKSLLPPDSKVKEYCLRLEPGFKQLKIADVVDACTNAVGKYSYDRAALNHSAQVVSRTLRKVGGTCCVFYRLQKRGVIYFAEEYPRQSLRKESSFITFQEDGAVKIGRIVRFVRWSNCGDLCDVDCRNCPADYVAIVRVMERKHWFIHDMRDIRISHIFHVQQTENITVVHVQSILSLCFYFEADALEYVAVPVNRLERE